MKRACLLMCLSAAAASLALCGCLSLKPATDPTRFYVLSCPGAAEPLTQEAHLGWSVCVAKIETPAYLDHPGLAVRRQDNQIEYLEWHQWAEPVQEGLTRCLREGLASLLGPARVAPLAHRRPAGPCLEVQASVSQFEINAAGQAVLHVRWRLVETGSGTVRHAQVSELMQAVPQPTSAPANAVAALSQLVAQWSRQVAEAVVRQVTSPSPAPGPGPSVTPPR